MGETGIGRNMHKQDIKMKKESYKEIYESIGLNVENSNSKTERKTGNKNRRNYEEISMIERNFNVTEDDFDSN